MSGKKTKSGAPILCNDPHLGLNLPSFWFEMQITTPTFNAYGVTFPGRPVLSLDLTTVVHLDLPMPARDVLDYYEIKFRDETMKEYWFNGGWRQTDFRYEHIGIKGETEMIDTVAYTIFRPGDVRQTFYGYGSTVRMEGYYAVRWKAT